MIKGMKKAFLLAFLFVVPLHVFAASLFFSPATESVSAGTTFTVAVDVTSADQAMNAASGDVSFPTDKLRVLNVSNTNSVMSLWVQNPTFSNAVSGGDVNFAGVVLNPGFTGSAGNVITIRFQALTAGTAMLSFSDGSVLANDGNGTNILDSLGTAHITITPAVIAPAPPTIPSPTPATSAPSSSVDTTPPNPFAITEVTTDPSDPQPIFTWSATDQESGISDYLVKIGNGDWFPASTIAVPGVSGEYQLPPQAPGQYVSIEVEAYDNAGNMTEESATFSVVAIPAPQATTIGWLGRVIKFLLTWGLAIILGLLLLGLIIALAYYIVNRLRRLRVSLGRRLIEERKEMRDDLRRIEKELEADQADSKIDLTAAGMRKKQERVHREIKHLEEDLKRDIKDEV
jgi:hypothetical protein